MKVLIGIDPDTNKNGVAKWSPLTKELDLHSFTFFELFDFLNIQYPGTIVIIEAGWMNQKSNYHLSKWAKEKKDDDSKDYGESIAKKVGACHEVGRKIVEMCEYLGIKYELVVPDNKRHKVKAEYFERLTGIKRSNQDTRDAAMLVFGK